MACYHGIRKTRKKFNANVCNMFNAKISIITSTSNTQCPHNINHYFNVKYSMSFLYGARTGLCGRFSARSLPRGESRATGGLNG